MARYDQCDPTCTVDCGHCKGSPPIAPAAPSLAAGAIARSLSDAAEAYRRETLTYLIATGPTGPWEDG